MRAALIESGGEAGLKGLIGLVHCLQGQGEGVVLLAAALQLLQQLFPPGTKQGRIPQGVQFPGGHSQHAAVPAQLLVHG